MTFKQLLKAATNYPVSDDTLSAMCIARGVDITHDAGGDIAIHSLLKADLYIWLSTAPNITENGVSFSFTNEEKERFVLYANRIYNAFGEAENEVEKPKPKWGWKGDRL